MFKANRTQIGGLIFGKEEIEPVKVAGPEVGLPPAALPDSNLVFPKPLPWLAPQAEGERGEGAAELTMHSLPGQVQGEPVQPRDPQALQKLQEQVLKLHKVLEERNYAESHRLSLLETQSQQSLLQESMLKEQLVALQADFKEFSMHALGRQLADHADMEGQVSHALARQNNSVEEWRLALKHKDAQRQSELEMLTASMEEIREKLLSSQAETRVRLTALEIRGDGGTGGLGDADSAYVAQTVDFLKQHVDRLQQGSVQAGAALSEMQARLEGETAARAAAQQEQSSRLEALNQALGFSRALMNQSVHQRIEALEERLGSERQEIVARHLRLRDEVVNEGQEGNAKMQSLAVRMASSMDSVGKRCAAMEQGHRDLESHFVDFMKASRSESDMMKAALASVSRKAEENISRQSEAFKQFKAEVEMSLRQLRDIVEAERRARLQDDKRICDEVTEASQKAVALEVATLQQVIKKQAENVTIELDRIRRINADRAERLSRYVDAALTDAGILPDASPGGRVAKAFGAEDLRLLRDLKEQVTVLQKDMSQQVQSLEHKSAEMSEELRSKLAKVADQREDEAKMLRREAEKAAQEVERRAFCRQEELEARFENYMRHFDNSINSVQAAVLRPWQEMVGQPGHPLQLMDPSPRGNGPGVTPLAEEQGETTLDPATRQVVASLWRHMMDQPPES